MQIDITRNKEKSEATVKISTTRDELEPYLREAAVRLTKGKPLKGFRPGKAPLKVVAEAVGHERLFNEAAQTAVPKIFVRAILDKDVDAIARPAVVINELSEENGLTFTATVVVLPEVTLGDFGSLTVTKRSVEVTDEDVEKELVYLAKTRSTHLDVARPAQEGDTVTVDFRILLNGELMEGGESKNHPVQVGEGHFVPDFEKNLLGIKAGDTREFNIEFPDDFAKKKLQGKTAQARVKAHAVQKRVVPELNDEFAKKVGAFDDLAALKYALKSNLTREREQREQERFQGELADRLAEATQFSHIPDVLIEKEIDRRVEEMEQMLAMQKKTLDEHLAGQQKKIADVRQEMRDSAERAVKVGLALRKLAYFLFFRPSIGSTYQAARAPEIGRAHV